MQLLVLSIAECSAAQAGWSLRCCIQLTWAAPGGGEVFSGRNVRVRGQPNSSEAATAAIREMKPPCVSSHGLMEVNWKGMSCSEAHICRPVVFHPEKVRRGAVSPVRMALGEQSYWAGLVRSGHDGFDLKAPF